MMARVKFEETRFLNDFYPFKPATALTIAFRPTKLIKSSAIYNYGKTHDYITEDQLHLLDYMIGDMSSIEDAIEHEENIETENYTPEVNWFHRTAGIDMTLSENGKDTNRSAFYWLRLPFTNPQVSTSINFIYYSNGNFYGVQPISFASQLRSTAYVKDSRTFDEEVLKTLYSNFDNEDNYYIDAYEFLGGSNFKSSKSTLSKVLIALLPQLKMEQIVELSDYINSEMVASKSSAEVAQNVFELRGELITYFYNVKNYYYPKEGTLGNSCMRYDQTTEQIRFYANNPTNVALLSYIENKKLLARAVLWTSVDGKKYSDRIYCSSSKYGTKLAGYCKHKGYKTIHYSTSLEYGLEMSKDCVTKLDTFELKNSHYPYLDSMVYIDVINNLLCPESQPISTYMKGLNKDFIIKNVNQNGYNCSDTDTYFMRNKKTGLRYLKDSKGQTIQDYLSRYSIIRKPNLCIVNRNDVLTINDNEKIDGDWAEKVLIKKYNSLRPTLSYKKKNQYCYAIKYFDKQHVVYSHYHKIFICKSECEFVSSINTYVLKEVIQSNNFRIFLKLSKLKKMYGGKLVRITTEYLNCIKEQVATLPFKEPLMDIRKSRVYNVSVQNILWNGIRIKGIIIPFKHLRFVRK